MKKIISYAWMLILMLPALMLFNDNEEKVWINILGVIYCYALYGLRRAVIPKMFL